MDVPGLIASPQELTTNNMLNDLKLGELLYRTFPFQFSGDGHLNSKLIYVEVFSSISFFFFFLFLFILLFPKAAILCFSSSVPKLTLL